MDGIVELECLSNSVTIVPPESVLNMSILESSNNLTNSRQNSPTPKSFI